MRNNLTKKGNLKFIPLLMCGGALFSMHFGASSMVWPMNWGKESGTSVWVAFLGAFISALLLVILGYIALAKGGGSFRNLSCTIFGKRFGVFFGCFAVAVNGPLYVIPRMSAASWDSVVQAFGLQPESRIPLIVFTSLFYLIAFFFLMNPGKTMDKISAFLFPILIAIVLTVVIKGLLHPLGTPVEKAYDNSPFAYGFTNGYATGEVLCALMYGAVIIKTLKSKGVPEEKLNRNVVLVGIVGISLLTVTHLCHMLIGASSGNLFPELNYTALYTAVASAEYGKIGGYLFTLALFLAAMTCTVGMASGCAEYMTDVLGSRAEYKKVAAVILSLSAVFGCMGLSGVLGILGPILDGIYPPTIVLVLYFAFLKDPSSSRFLQAGRWSAYTAFVFGMIDMLWKYSVRLNVLRSFRDFYESIPLAGISLLWIPCAAAVFLIGALSMNKSKISS